MHQLEIKVLNIIDARCKHEHYLLYSLKSTPLDSDDPRNAGLLAIQPRDKADGLRTLYLI